MPRFILLEHTGAPDDSTGRHFDLLLEAGEACHTWRLEAIPEPGGQAVAAVEIVPHRLAWLDHGAGEVSGGRGFARRVDGGTYDWIEPRGSERPKAAASVARIEGVLLAGTLVIERTGEGVSVRCLADE